MTEIEKNLIASLKLNAIPKGTIVAMLLHLKEEQQQLDMMQYVLENRYALPNELLDIAIMIGKNSI